MGDYPQNDVIEKIFKYTRTNKGYYKNTTCRNLQFKYSFIAILMKKVTITFNTNQFFHCKTTILHLLKVLVKQFTSKICDNN